MQLFVCDFFALNGRGNFFSNNNFIDAQVVLSVYCKKANKTETSVTFESDKVMLHIVGPNGEVFDKTLKLFEKCSAADSSFRVLGTKVEIKLKKAEPVQWEQLEM